MAERIRIARAEAIHVRVPFRRPLLDATGEYTHRRAWILRLVDGGGREGLGEAVLSPAANEVTTERLAALVRDAVPRIVQSGPPDERSLLSEGEPGRALLAALSGACGAILAVPGGPAAARSVAVSSTIGFGGPDAGAEAAAQAVELGFGTLELRAGAERRTDQLVDRLRAIRAAVGPEPRLRIDVGGAWTVDTAIERLAAVEPFRVEFVEQPLAPWDLAGHAALRARTRVPIALDESVDSEAAARQALDAEAADVLVVKPGRVGGETVTRRIATAAAGSGATVVLGTFLETGVGIAAALRIASALPNDGTHALATAGVLAHDLLRTPVAIEDGRMLVPPEPALDEDEVAARATERFEARA